MKGVILPIMLSLTGMMFFTGCHIIVDNTGSNGADSICVKAKPINVVVYLDMSDRLLKQTDDCEMIWTIAKTLFPTKSPHKNKNKLQCVVYPNPNLSNDLSDLKIDLRSMVGMQKVGYVWKLDSGKVFIPKLREIYSQAIQNEIWLGSDEWGFFDNEVNNYLEPDYRNIFIVITDGYIYEVNNKGSVVNENEHKYRNMYSCLRDPEGQIEPVSAKFSAPFEVISLQLDKANYDTYKNLVAKREKWFESMGSKPYSFSKDDQSKLQWIEKILK